MTFDEWKEKHSDLIENVAITFFNYGRGGVDTKTCYDELEYLLKKAFTAGKTKWHKVADGDLPESLMSVVNQCGEKVTYNDYCKSWRYDDTDEYFCAKPIAWCEIPKFSE